MFPNRGRLVIRILLKKRAQRIADNRGYYETVARAIQVESVLEHFRFKRSGRVRKTIKAARKAAGIL